MLYVVNNEMCVVCARVAEMPDAEGVVGPAEMRSLRRTDLGIKKETLGSKSVSRA
jgi:hypothetical protein